MRRLLLLVGMQALSLTTLGATPVANPVANWADCLACHTDPTAGLPALSGFRPVGLEAAMVDCQDCHTPLELTGARNNWTHPVRGLASHLACTDCHAAVAHDSGQAPPRPLGDYNSAGCYSCHREVEARRSMLWAHGDRPGINCRDCHPAHQPLPAGLPAALLPSSTSSVWLNGYDWWASNRLCLDCHVPAGLILPLNQGFVTLNTVNYHDLHTGRGQVLCIECHDPHGSNRRGMLRDTLLSGEWLGYFDRLDGGSCSVICHGVDHDGWQYINVVQ